MPFHWNMNPVVFQVGPDDARSLTPYVRPEFDADDLVNLPLHRAAVKMRLQGQTLPAFSLETHGPIAEPPDANARETRIRNRSIELYTPKNREEVLDWLKKKYTKQRFVVPPKVENSGSSDDWIVPADSGDKS